MDFIKMEKERLTEYQGQIDICLSMGRLEHYTPEALVAEIRRMHSVLRTGGAATHIIDHRDHYWHADSAIPVFRHFHFTDGEWRKWYHNKLFYINRLTQSDYIRLFEENGFRIVYRGSKPYPHDALPVARQQFQPQFQMLTDKDLSATVSHLVAVKK
jgi:cyclopropane fatty-acyl-phospholipid synthase-like methyltransferase